MINSSTLYTIRHLGAGIALWVCFFLGACSESSDQYADGFQSKPPSDIPKYSESIAGIQGERDLLRVALSEAGDRNARTAVIEKAREVLVSRIFSDLMPHWYGTPWDYEGTTETPGEGQIACGYFVSTVLRDAGMKVERYKLAQQASQNIIRSLTGKENMSTFHGGKFGDFVSGINGLGDGLFIIGLDRHVGFIVQQGGEAFFVHSDGGANKCVVKEPLAEADVLKRSRYRVVGKISADDALICRWLEGEHIPTVL